MTQTEVVLVLLSLAAAFAAGFAAGFAMKKASTKIDSIVKDEPANVGFCGASPSHTAELQRRYAQTLTWGDFPLINHQLITELKLLMRNYGIEETTLAALHICNPLHDSLELPPPRKGDSA